MDDDKIFSDDVASPVVGTEADEIESDGDIAPLGLDPLDDESALDVNPEDWN